MDDVFLNKAQSIERCIKRIQEEYTNFEQFSNNFTKQDSIILNILRACETAIDMGTRTIRLGRLGLPKNSHDVFTLLQQANIISMEICKKMQAMVGFRNIAVHEYININLNIVKIIIETNLHDILEFSKVILFRFSL
jgi:uncharacterized protein YutE (UPF0331/DUF86 family)